MAHAIEQLQKAVFAKLTADSELSALVGSNAIYDHLIESEEFPYVAIGNVGYLDWSTSSDDGAELLLTAHIWDRGQSRVRALKILERITQLFDEDLTLESHRVVLQVIDFAEVRREPNSSDFHGLVRLRTKLEAQ